jgi:hypothetical protein
MADSKPPVANTHSSDSSGLGSMLCTRCGLCCMGVIHQAATLDEDEISAAQELGLPVLDRADPGFALPCPRLAGTVCTIYEQRPRVCGRYLCQLLQDLESGKIGFDESLTIVASARAQLAKLRLAMPATMSVRAAVNLAKGAQSPPHDLSERELTELKLQATALELYLDKHFRNERDGRSLDLCAVMDSAKEPR